MRPACLWITLLAVTVGVAGCGRRDRDQQADAPPQDVQETQVRQEQPPEQRDDPPPAAPETPRETAGTKTEPPPPARPETPRDTAPRDTAPAAEAVENPLDLAYITEDFIGAIIVHPRRLLESPLYQQLQESGAPIEEQLEVQAQTFGVEPQQIEQVIVLIDPSLAAAAPMLPGFGPPQPGDDFRFPPDQPNDGDDLPRLPQPPADDFDDFDEDEEEDEPAEAEGLPLPPADAEPLPEPVAPGDDFAPDFGRDAFPFSAIIRFSEPVDQQAVIEQVLGETEERTHEGKTYLASEQGAAFLPDEQTIVIATEELLQKMITVGEARSPLIERLSRIDAGNDVIVAVDLLSLRETFKQLAQAAAEQNEMLADFARVPETLRSISLTVSLTDDDLARLTMQADDHEAAAHAQGVVTGLVEMGRILYMAQSTQARQDPDALPADVREAMTIADRLVAGIRVRAQEDEVVVNVARPEDFEKLPELLGPAVQRAQAATKGQQRLNNLKMIGLAMHNYHDAFRSFPPSPDVKGTGLSWRVHLLLFLDHADLYDQFNFDEPWDSEHNKGLIALMPDIFRTPGVDDEGKTSLHVFVGKGAPFEGEHGPMIQDITDGTSNTLMVVEAGPETAVEWTRPGGLEFDPEDPHAALEDIPEETFLGLLFDGAVRRFAKDIPAETLKALITPAGGEVIDFDDLQ